MSIRLTAALCVAPLLFLAGCFPNQLILPNDPPPADSRPPAPSRIRPAADPATELRIPGQAVAQHTDIPVVPVPPIPYGQGATERNNEPRPMPEIKQASTLPSLPPPPTPPKPTTGEAPLLQIPPGSPTPSQNPVPANPMETGDLKQVIHLSNAAYGQIDSYMARLTRREQVNGKNKPEELMLFKFRKQPWSVYFKWLGTEGHDREVVYVKDKYENKIHTLLAAGDVLFMPAGKRMALAPDSVMVKTACRYPITEAGMGASITRITALQAAIEHGDKTHGTLADLGVQKRPDYPGPLRLIEHTIPANVEQAMTRGGKRIYGFDLESRLPVLLLCVDDKGQEVEYYRYDRVMSVKLDDADFNPDNLGASTKMAKNP
jgi:hypothetical protein